MKSTARLIVLSHTKIGGNSVVIHTLSQQWGRRGFLVRVGKGVPMALFLPLNILEAEVVENPKSPLWRATSVSPAVPLNGIRNNLYKNTMTLFLSEVLFRTIKDGPCEEGLFDWCERSIRTLDALESDWSNFHLRFLLEFSGALGFRPAFGDIAPFAEGNLPQLRALTESDFKEALLVPLSGESRNALCESILRYLEYHTESAIRVRSLAVLRELFA